MSKFCAYNSVKYQEKMDIKVVEYNEKNESVDTIDYEGIRIKNIQKAFQCSENIKESCHFLIDSVEESLENLKEKRIRVSARLGEALARKESLRKKDYNIIISDIYRLLDEKERNAKCSFMSYIEEQNDLTQSLKNILLNISDYNKEELKEKKELLKEELSEIADRQESRKEAVIKILTEFQEIHKNVMRYLESLVEKVENISIRDIKKAKNIIIKEQAVL